MSFQPLIDYLNDQQVKFTLSVHSPVYTAQEVAARAHVRGKSMGKVVVMVFDGCLALCVMPSHYHVDSKQLAHELGAGDLRIAEEGEFASTFPGCELGAIPPFSELWNVPVYMSEDFDINEDISFNAGNWSEIVRMSCRDYIWLEQPILVTSGLVGPNERAVRAA